MKTFLFVFGGWLMIYGLGLAPEFMSKAWWCCVAGMSMLTVLVQLTDKPA